MSPSETSPRRATWRDLWILAVFFGLAAGLVDVILLGIQRYAMGRLIFLSRDVVWMSPVANAAYCLGVAVLLLAIGRVRRKPVTLTTAIAVYAFVAGTAVLFMYPRLSRWTEMLLALGVAVQGARMLRSRTEAFRRLAGRLVVVEALVVITMGTALHVRIALRERGALARLPAAQAGAPNIVLLILDTVRSMDLSLYGYERPTTPELSRLAQQGTLFQHAISAAPWTLPSHAAMFTGHWTHDLTADWGTALDGTYPTVAEVLSRRGYVTAGFAANMLFCTWESGLTRGFAHYEDFPITIQQAIKSTSLGRVVTQQRWFRLLTGLQQRLARQDAADINREALGWLDRHRDRPFFAFLNYFDAHAPYLPPAPYDTLFGPVLPLRGGDPDTPSHWTEEDVQANRDAYDRSIAYLDHEIGALLDSLDRRGLLRNTVVIIASDHGEEFAEHGVMGHGNSLYRPSLQVPLLILGPGRVPAGRVIEPPVSTRELAPTILDLAGASSAAPFPGRSLTRFWQDSAAAAASAEPVLSEVSYVPRLPPYYPVSKGDMVSVLDDGYRYIRDGDGREELYSFEQDPLEQRDLAGEPRYGILLRRLAGVVDSLTGREPAAK